MQNWSNKFVKIIVIFGEYVAVMYRIILKKYLKVVN